LLENKIVFLLITIMLLYLMFTSTGLAGLKRLISDITGSGTASTGNGIDNTKDDVVVGGTFSGGGSPNDGTGSGQVSTASTVIRI